MENPYETHMQLMHEAILALLTSAMERTTRFPQNGYRRRQYFEGMAHLGENLSLISGAAAALVKLAGKDFCLSDSRDARGSA